MNDIWTLATGPTVLPFTLVVLLVGGYWLLFTFGLVDSEGGDLNLDDGGGGVEGLEVEGGAPDLDGADGTGVESEPGVTATVLTGVLRFLNATDVPVMVVFSFITILTWASAMIGALYLNPILPFPAVLAPLISLASGLLLGKIFTQPLKPVFRLLKADEAADPIVGKAGIVRSGVLDQESGQVLVSHRGTDAMLNCRLPEGLDPVPRGTEVVIFHHTKADGTYLATPVER